MNTIKVMIEGYETAIFKKSDKAKNSFKGQLQKTNIKGKRKASILKVRDALWLQTGLVFVRERKLSENEYIVID